MPLSRRARLLPMEVQRSPLSAKELCQLDDGHTSLRLHDDQHLRRQGQASDGSRRDWQLDVQRATKSGVVFHRSRRRLPTRVPDLVGATSRIRRGDPSDRNLDRRHHPPICRVVGQRHRCGGRSWPARCRIRCRVAVALSRNEGRRSVRSPSLGDAPRGRSVRRRPVHR
jgi:hypothetical protein